MEAMRREKKKKEYGIKQPKREQLGEYGMTREIRTLTKSNGSSFLFLFCYRFFFISRLLHHHHCDCHLPPLLSLSSSFHPIRMFAQIVCTIGFRHENERNYLLNRLLYVCVCASMYLCVYMDINALTLRLNRFRSISLMIYPNICTYIHIITRSQSELSDSTYEWNINVYPHKCYKAFL